MSAPWTYHCPTRILFGQGQLAALAGELQTLGMARPLVVTDPGIEAAGILTQVLAAIGTEATTVYAGVSPNPKLEAVEAALDLYRTSDCDGIVAVGGGSVLDAGKAVALLASNPGPLSAYHVFQNAPRPVANSLPSLVAIPTTAGTGSEVSRGLAVAEAGGHAKIVVLHPRLFPAAALCDPLLTLGLPPTLTAGTGVDALVHCIEAFLSTASNPLIDGLALEGAARIWCNLPRSVADGRDVAARDEVMLGALLGGLSMPKGLGLAHAFALSLEEPRLHHGTLVGLLLPRVLAWSGTALAGKAAVLAAALGLSPSADLPDAMDQFNRQIGLPAEFADLAIEDVALATAANGAVCTPYQRLAPRHAGADTYLALLLEWAHRRVTAVHQDGQGLS